LYIEAEECFRTLARDAEEVVLGIATANSLKYNLLQAGLASFYLRKISCACTALRAAHSARPRKD